MSKKLSMTTTLALCAVAAGVTQAAFIIPPAQYVAPGSPEPALGTQLLAPSGAQVKETLHNDPRWQVLGTLWGIDDGVKWSINGGGFAAVDESHVLTIGDKVQFEFDISKQLWGTHSFDAIRVWNGNNVIKLYQEADLTVEDYSWDFNKDDPAKAGTQSYYHDYNSQDYDDWGASVNMGVKNANWDRYYAGVSEDFFSEILTVTEDFSLTARVTCSRDLGGGSYPGTPNWNNFTKTAKFSQGETEEYCFTTKPQDVPEPSLISLMGFGLLGITLLRKKKST